MSEHPISSNDLGTSKEGTRFDDTYSEVDINLKPILTVEKYNAVKIAETRDAPIAMREPTHEELEAAANQESMRMLKTLVSARNRVMESFDEGV